MINFPNNPTAAACSRAEMAAIAEVMLRRPDIWILTDDIYEHLVYDDFEFYPLAPEYEPDEDASTAITSTSVVAQQCL